MQSAKRVSWMFMTWVSLADIWSLEAWFHCWKLPSKIKEGGGGLLETDLIWFFLLAMKLGLLAHKEKKLCIGGYYGIGKFHRFCEDLELGFVILKS